MTDKPHEADDLSDDDFQAQCTKLVEQIAPSNGLYHPAVVKSVFAEIVARTISINVDCLGCAAREAFSFDLGVRAYINDHWDEWQKRRAELLGIEIETHGTTVVTGEEKKVLH